jgi:hypothetical protein
MPVAWRPTINIEEVKAMAMIFTVVIPKFSTACTRNALTISHVSSNHIHSKQGM